MIIFSILAAITLASAIPSPVSPVTRARADLALLSRHKNGDGLETGFLTPRSVSADVNAQLPDSFISFLLGGNRNVQISTATLVNALADLSPNTTLGNVLKVIAQAAGLRLNLEIVPSSILNLPVSVPAIISSLSDLTSEPVITIATVIQVLS